jgi:5'-deoxynucleotidase YfbR-like HD superfamily hydrolase
MSLRNAFDIIVQGGNVRRYHAKAIVKEQTVGAHSHRVAMWVVLLTNGTPSVTLLMAALTHDLAEFQTGDMPAPTKRKMNIQEQFAAMEAAILAPEGLDYEARLSDDEARTLKLADAYDGLVYCAEEMRRGNNEMRDTYDTFRSYYLSLTPMFTERELLVIVDNYATEFK